MPDVTIGTRVLEAGLAALHNECDAITICSSKPTSYVEAYNEPDNVTPGYRLGLKTFTQGTVFGAASADGTGGMTSASVPISATGDISKNGDANWWAALDTTQTRLLATGLIEGGSSGEYSALSVKIDNTHGPVMNTSPANLPSTANGAQGTLSLWFKIIGGTDNTHFDFLYCGDNAGVNKLRLVRYESDNSIRLLGARADGTVVLDLEAYPTGGYTTTSRPGWHHLIASWDVNAPAANMMLDGANSGFYLDAGAGGNTLTWGLAGMGLEVGGNALADQAANTYAEIADLFLAVGPGTYINLATAGNLEKFRSAEGRPVDLGSNGSIPLSLTPQVYLSGGATGWATNKGNAGNFTKPAGQGALVDGSDSPSTIVTIPNVGTGQNSGTGDGTWDYTGLTPTAGNYALVMVAHENGLAAAVHFTATFNTRSMTRLTEYGTGFGAIAAFVIAITEADYDSAATVAIAWTDDASHRSVSAVGYTISSSNGNAFAATTDVAVGVTSYTATPTSTGDDHQLFVVATSNNDNIHVNTPQAAQDYKPTLGFIPCVFGHTSGLNGSISGDVDAAGASNVNWLIVDVSP